VEERIREVLETVLSKVKPTEEEEKRIISVVEKIRDLLRGLDVEVHGSFRKGTWLRGDTDVDLFVFFPKEVGKEFLSKEGLDTIKERLKGLEVKMAYAEHPYLIVSLDGIEVDVVPALRVGEGSEAVTAVDRTPFHTMYVTSKLDERGRDQVRLLKRFLKGVGVYGAEIKVLGFSGYVSELLTIYYGSFLEVLKGS
jgi:tRNA adenylyltransferase (EC 2.7.7.25)